EIDGSGPDFGRLVRAVRDAAVKLIEESDAPAEAVRVVESIDNAGALADRVAANAGLRPSEKIEILRELDVTRRLERLLVALERRIAELAAVAKEPMDPKLHEQVLRQRLAEIQEELGEEPDDDGDEFAKKISDAKMPPEAEQAARRELRRLRT